MFSLARLQGRRAFDASVGNRVLLGRYVSCWGDGRVVKRREFTRAGRGMQDGMLETRRLTYPHPRTHGEAVLNDDFLTTFYWQLFVLQNFIYHRMV